MIKMVSWWGKTVSFVKKAGKQLVKDVSGGLDLLSAAFVEPRETLAAVISRKPKKIIEVVKKVRRKKAKETIPKALVTTAVAGVGVIAAPKLLAVPAIKTAAVSAGLLGGTLAVAAPETTSMIIGSPELSKVAAATAVGGAPAGILVGLETGTSVLKEAFEKVPEKLKTPAKIAAGAALAAGAVAVAPKVIEKIKGLGTQTLELPKEKEMGVGDEIPVLPETTTITAGTRRYRRARPKVQPIKQSVKVMVNTRSRSTGIRQSL